MKRALVMILVLSMIVPMTLSSHAMKEYQERTISTVQKGANEFASSLTVVLADQAKMDNLVFSPLSIRSALSMTALGADSTTAEQMEEVLSFSDFRSHPLKEAPGLSIVNSVWIDERYPVASDFIREAEEQFDAKVSTLDFSDYKSVSTINHWVSNATKRKIESIIDRLDADMRMVLINAVHFLGDWAVPFDPNDTHERTFHAPHRDVATPFMHSDRSMLTISLGDAAGVALPYTDERFLFFALLPPEEVGLLPWVARQGSTLVDSLLDAVDNGMEQRVRLAIPKFIDRSTLGLSDSLRQVGLTEAFDPSLADFSKMSAHGAADLFIGDVLHKTFIRFDEKGTEAAAVTAVMMELTSMMPSGIPMLFDRPFFYGILDMQDANAVFLGLMQTPSAP